MAESGRRRAAVDSVLRARDIDRAQASTVLDAAYAEGPLGAQETTTASRQEHRPHRR
ncbi:hypothetical protein [Nocardia sp. NPDC003183]